jgi:hypothetical protein
MLTEKVCYTEEPVAVLFMPLPKGGADLWLRKNAAEVEDDDNTHWEADEAYMRLDTNDTSEEAVNADFEQWYSTAAEWTAPVPAKPKSPEERIAELEKQLADVLRAVKSN